MFFGVSSIRSIPDISRPPHAEAREASGSKRVDVHAFQGSCTLGAHDFPCVAISRWGSTWSCHVRHLFPTEADALNLGWREWIPDSSSPTVHKLGMVLPMFWPGSIFFSSIADTSAVDLTDTHAGGTNPYSTVAAAFGCGDHRNSLFVHSQRHNSEPHSRLIDIRVQTLAILLLLLSSLSRPGTYW